MVSFVETSNDNNNNNTTHWKRPHFKIDAVDKGSDQVDLPSPSILELSLLGRHELALLRTQRH